MFTLLVPRSRQSVLPDKSHIHVKPGGQALFPYMSLPLPKTHRTRVRIRADISPKKTEQAAQHVKGAQPQRPCGQRQSKHRRTPLPTHEDGCGRKRTSAMARAWGARETHLCAPAGNAEWCSRVEIAWKIPKKVQNRATT